MVEYIYLKPDEQMPEMADEDAWLVVEASDDDRFFGSGYGFKASGEGVFYASLPKSDLSLESALDAAKQWAAKYQVPRIWVQATPD
ncbi:hypothetical protein F7D01_08715 [Erythrobacter sp. 3-20A1M]|jgi:hypothetical protein|uniref:hypothetical protein n=1 Tax=Erythrobacter sp. 3-20A1M TaxID=2653850 RepID=UPI001BFC9978|nr:hypothetical protein [Erythrobacter sp. 3-20A1M]QWC57157.1 hypothetical protein F7D01_08715 [Erythrobacter sp. 3-20A1M]